MIFSICVLCILCISEDFDLKHATLVSFVDLCHIRVIVNCLQREGQSGSFQPSLRRTAKAPADLATRQEALQDRDSPIGHLLHRLLEPRSRGLTRKVNEISYEDYIFTKPVRASFE